MSAATIFMARLCFCSHQHRNVAAGAKFQYGALAEPTGEVSNKKAKRDHHNQRLSQHE